MRTLLAILAVLVAFSGICADRFQLSVQTYQTSEDGQVTRHLLFTDTEKFSFAPPTVDWKVGAEPAEKKVVFRSADGLSSILMEFAPTNSTLQPKVNVDALRKQLLTRYPENTIIQQFSCGSGAGLAQAFDLRGQTENTAFVRRIVFVPYEHGTVELSTVSAANRFKDDEPALMRVVGSTQILPLAEAKQ